MFFDEWHVLVVDDEPDVLELTKLVMRDFEVDSVPVRVHTASSKAEALELIRSEFTDARGDTKLAVAFIDVVMETDSAGLDLCHALRYELNNTTTQLYIRTGQPGIAPEREVIDKYDINGYFTKVEATEDKLYTLVKSGVRQYLWMAYSTMMHMAMHGIVLSSLQSPESLQGMMQESMSEFAAHRSSDGRLVQTLWIGDEMLISVNEDEDAARKRRERLLQLETTSLSPEGDEYGLNPETNEVIFYIAETPLNPAGHFIGETYMIPSNPYLWLATVYQFRSVIALWNAAKQRQTA